MRKTYRLATIVLVLSGLTVTAQGQGGPVCSVNTDSVTPNCSASGFLSSVPGFVCAHRTITCPTVGGVSINPMGITLGYLTPTSALGTIVLFSNSGGIVPAAFPGAERDYAYYYYTHNFQVVETAWDSDWEDTGTATKNVAYAAGRPAAFLNWVRYGSTTGGTGLWSTGGMCIHGTSAGSAAGAYALAWYGASSYIDKLTALSGPTLSNIAQGCKVGAIINVAVCPAGQLGCNPSNAVSTWSQPPNYTDAKSSVRTWTGDPTCAGMYTTSGSSYTAWNAMSIADGTVATYNYPQTNITAWLCANVKSSDGLNDGIMNNSSPQAQLFFQNFTSLSQFHGLVINAVTACNGDEGVTDGVPPLNYSGTGMQAIESDMITDAVNKCQSHH